MINCQSANQTANSFLLQGPKTVSLQNENLSDKWQDQLILIQ